MTVNFSPCTLHGKTDAPPSKSMAHRYLIGAALSGEKCTLTGVEYSEDILATIDCLTALGAKVTVDGGNVTVERGAFTEVCDAMLDCRESGSTLRFFIPLALCLGRAVTLRGSERLFERPLGVYEELCRERGFDFAKDTRSLTLCGKLERGSYRVRGDVSSQFITGLIFALVHLGGDSVIEIVPPFESRPYVDLTLKALRDFGADVCFANEHTIVIKAAKLHGFSGKIEGDYSNAAFLDAFNCIGSEVEIGNLNPHSLQGDRVYAEYFKKLSSGSPTLDISDCPDLGPILFALAALKNGAVFTGTDRLRAKESDRAVAMDAELKKLGGGLVIGDNTVTVPKQKLCYRGEVLHGHCDHRIVMAMSVVLSVTGGELNGAEAVKKSYPDFFEVIKSLGAKIDR